MIESYVYDIIYIVLGFIFLLTLYRLVVGPSIPDRAMSLDAGTNLLIAGMVIWALDSGRGIYIDVAIVYAILAFVGVVALARYIEGRVKE